MRELLAAVQPRCAGKNLDEIEEILREEMRARGVEIPEVMIPGAVSMIRDFADLGEAPPGLRGLRSLLRIFRAAVSEASHSSDTLTGPDPGAGPIRDPDDPMSAWVDVILDDDGKRVLLSRRHRHGLMAGVRDQVAVRLERNERLTSGTSVDAYVDEDRVGTLNHTDGLRYLPAISAARERGERGLLTLGIATAQDGAGPRLRIAQTETT